MKKKNLLIFSLIPVIAVLIVLTIAGVNYSKADFGSDFKTEGTVLLKYNGTSSDVQIPDGITKLGRDCFSNNPMITNVSFSDSIEEIDNNAFDGCVNLKEIELSNSVKKIGDFAFSGCSSLSKVSIGENLFSLGDGAFSNCSSLNNISISDNNLFLICDKGAIYSHDKSKLYCYLAGSKRQQYIMPNDVKNISRYAFYGANNLKEVITSSNLKEINDYTFYNCPNLESVTINIPVTTINMGAFQSCVNLKQVIMPESIIKILDSAFNNCNKDLTFICNNNSYASKYAASNNIKTSDASVISVPIQYRDEEFDNISENKLFMKKPLNNSFVEKDSANNKSEDDLNLKDNLQKADAYYSDLLNGRNVGDSKIVSDKAFLLLDNLIVNSGDSIKNSDNTVTVKLNSIEDYAFYNSNIDNFDFNSVDSNVSVIGKFSFARTKLRNIDIPDGIITIGYGAFYHCDDLAVINIPDSVTSVEPYAFEYTKYYNDFINSNNEFLIVGDGVLVKYNGNSKNIVIPEEVKYISSYAFADNSDLETVEFSDNLISISRYGFNNCINLNTISNMPDGIVISEETFNGCNLSLD